MILVPFEPALSADQELRIMLGDELAVLCLIWNVKAEFWYLDVGNADNSKELTSLKVVPGWPLFDVAAAAAPIAGNFMALRMDEQAGNSIGYYDLGARWGLYWMDDSEILAWRKTYGLE